MAPTRIFGKISDAQVGAAYADRAALAESGIHRPLVAGISGSAKEGADSIVMSGGYEDDEDYGDVIIYTGHGGNDPNTGKQIDDQTWTRNNLALRKNYSDGHPVRVIRGHKLESPYAPKSGYRYDGLHYVEEYWRERGKSGFLVCRFRLVRDDDERSQWSKTPSDTSLPVLPPPRATTTVQRIVRSTSVVQAVKRLHDFNCQVCGTRLAGPAGPYAEGAHIKPLGRPHNGPDAQDNVLCLCPNCHVLLDIGAITIGLDLEVICGGADSRNRLRTVVGHDVSKEYLAYHRDIYSP